MKNKKSNKKFDIIKRRFLENGDLIYQANNPDIQKCMLVDGSCKKYRMLNNYDEVWIKEDFQFKKGKIVEMKYIHQINNYIYKVKTKKEIKWREMSDFRFSHLLCLKNIAPDKRVIDLIVN